MNSLLMLARFMWFPFLMACPIYLLVAHFIITAGDPSIPMLRWYFLAISLGQIAIAMMVIQPICTKRIEDAFGSELRTLIMMRLLLSAALYESIAIYGLIIVILNHTFVDAIAFTALAAAMLIQIFPRAADFED